MDETDKTPTEATETTDTTDTTPEVTEDVALENSKNPERTAQYIDKLKTERDSYKNVLESLRPDEQHIVKEDTYSNLKQDQIDDVVQSLVDKDGYLDGNKLQDTLNSLNARLIEAESKAKAAEDRAERVRLTQQDFETKEVMRKVHEKYPTLDPQSEAFDADFFEAVRNDLIGQMFEGREDPMAAADKIHGILYNRNMTKQEKVEQVKKEDAKRAINAVGTRSTITRGYFKEEEDADLRDKVRAGTKGALAEALRRRNS